MASGTQNGRGNKLTNKYLFISGFTLNRGQVVSVTMTEKGKQSGFFSIFCICNIHSGLAKSFKAKILT